MSVLLRVCLVLKMCLMSSISHTFELFRSTLHIWETHRTQRLYSLFGPLLPLELIAEPTEPWVSIELKIMFQATNFSKQILSFLAHGASSIVKILNQSFV
jgi:hypothetical protein